MICRHSDKRTHGVQPRRSIHRRFPGKLPDSAQGRPVVVPHHGTADPYVKRRRRPHDFLKLILERYAPNILDAEDGFNLTVFHRVAGAGPHVTGDERLAFATALMDAGAQTDLCDHLLNSTSLGWVCRWGLIEPGGTGFAEHPSPRRPVGLKPWQLRQTTARFFHRLWDGSPMP